MIGTTLSHYRITEKLGAGGMGEVYRAEDTNLDRQVAIKVIPDIFSGDPERLARFEREAKLLASLNHPNIAAVYGLEEAGGKRFLVLELVEGETLAQRIAKGPLPVDETLEVCRQIAEGLEAAHEKGVIHRDLKPANVKITPEGKVKVLDFGLAKAFQGEMATADASHSPTLTDQMTRPGVILGTAAYMSPEQAKGKTVNKRADIWAFGCILYECLTGKRAFQGDTTTEVVASILKSQPDWTLLPAETPAVVLSLMRRCFQKDPSLRLRDIGDARIEITEAVNLDVIAAPVPMRRLTRTWMAVTLVLGLLVAALAAAVIYITWMKSPEQVVVQSTIELPAGTRLTGRPYPSRTELALSPDGKYLVFSASPDGNASGAMLYRRALAQSEAEPVNGTEQARQPFFSPDGKWIGFWANGKLSKVPAEGGIPKDLTAYPGLPMGTTWSDGGKIIWGGEGLQWIPAEGGMAQDLTTIDPTRDAQHTLPFALPGGKAILFTAMPDAFGTRARIEAVSFANGTRKLLIEDAADARYLPTGHLVFLRQGQLMAVSFDPARLEVTGTAARVLLSGVEQALNVNSAGMHSGAGQFSVSRSGLLAHAAGGIDHIPKIELVWVDRQGKVEVLAGFDKPEVTNQVRFSPDGRRLAFPQHAGPLWLFDLERTTYTKLFPEGISASPRWSPDGRRLAFSWSVAGPISVWLATIEGGGALERLIESKSTTLWLSSWSTDGKYLALVGYGSDTGTDIVIYRMEEKKLVPFLNSRSAEGYPEFSLDSLCFE
jgi:hypothetical protein